MYRDNKIMHITTILKMGFRFTVLLLDCLKSGILYRIIACSSKLLVSTDLLVAYNHVLSNKYPLVVRKPEMNLQWNVSLNHWHFVVHNKKVRNNTIIMRLAFK